MLFRKLFMNLCMVGALLFGASGGTLAADDADAVAIKAVIQTQLDAFRQGDAETAYAQAAPSIRTIFPSTERFMRMVRGGYAALIEPSAVTFSELRTNADRGLQEVVVIDRAGKGWIARYMMQRQEDGTWRIAGCHLSPLDDENV